MRFKSIISVAGLYIMLTAGTHAAPVYIYDSADIIGISGLEVNGDLWDVDMHDGSYDEIIASGYELLNSREFAYAAADALYEFSLSNSVTPDTFLGCVTECHLDVGYLAWDDHTLELAIQSAVVDNSGNYRMSMYGISGYNDFSNAVYTSWTAVVPAPSAGLLMTSGLIGLGSMARRKKS